MLDLGCGTGTMTEILAEAGYDMIGVDNSGEMLAEAMEKRVESGHDILYLLQDMQEFELYEETGINTYELALFIPREDGLYEKDEEVHYQRAYPLEKIKELIGKAGMELLAVYDAYTLEPPKEDSGRLTFVVREHGK